MKIQRFKLVTTQSEISWTGRSVTGVHNGTIAFKDGLLDFKNDRLTGGKFTVDATSIKILDITDPATNAQFAAHLASDDFFSSARYPTADFEILTVTKQSENLYQVIGNLTIKGITLAVSLEAEIILNGQTINASATMVLNRTVFDMKFRSGNFFKNLGDTLIYNNFSLNINLIAEVVPSAVMV